MDRDEEILYLSQLCLDAARWNRDPDEPLTGLELEVRDRLRTLTGHSTVDSDGFAQSEDQEPKLDIHIEKPVDRYSETHVRVRENGKATWIYREDAVKVMDGPNKFHWERRKDEKS